MHEDKLKHVAMLFNEKVIRKAGWEMLEEPHIDEKHNEIYMDVKGQKKLKIGIRYKRMITGTALPKFQQAVDIKMLAAQHLPKAIMARIKNEAINAIDETGNFNFSYKNGKENLMFYEFENKPPKKRPVRNQAFSPKAGFVVMALLNAKDFRIQTMRELQAKTGVSLSGISSICKTLQQNHFIDYSYSKPIRVLNPGQFLDEWAAYSLQFLAPKTGREGYQIHRVAKDVETGEKNMTRTPWQKATDLLFHKFESAALTGVQAAQSVSKFYSLDVGEVLIGSLKLAESELRQQFVITKSNKPDLVLIEPYNGSAFMEMTDTPEQRTANPIQIYLDLLASDDPRANEFADIYREKALGY